VQTTTTRNSITHDLTTTIKRHQVVSETTSGSSSISSTTYKVQAGGKVKFWSKMAI
jgi:hypothetical protein